MKPYGSRKSNAGGCVQEAEIAADTPDELLGMKASFIKQRRVLKTRTLLGARNRRFDSVIMNLHKVFEMRL